MNTRGTSISAGFTLLELLMTITILSVVSTIGATGFYSIASRWSDQLLMQRINRTLSLAFSEMKTDFENLVSSEVSGVSLNGQMADMEDNLHFWQVAFENDRVTLPVEFDNPVTKQRDRHFIHYEIDRSGDTPNLVRYTGAWGADKSSLTSGVVFPGITGMRIHYLDGRIWRSQWDGKAMPAAVRVSLSVMENRRVDKHISRVVIFNINVN